MEWYALKYQATVGLGTRRLDAEHYQERYLTVQQKLHNFGAVRLRDLVAIPVVTGHTPSMKIDEYYGGQVRLIKTDNLREFKITGGFTHHLSELGDNVISRSRLKTDDLLLTIIGATYKVVGRAALVREKASARQYQSEYRTHTP